MTNRELFTQMMKHNTSLPTEQTSFQVLERSRGKGYVRSSTVRYIAAAFIAASVAVGLVFAVKHRGIETADEISSPAASRTDTAQSAPDKTAPAVFPDIKQKTTEITQSAPYKTVPAVSPDIKQKIDALLEDMERTGAYTATLCTRSDTGENGIEVSKYRENIPADTAEIARYFRSAELEPVSEYEADPLFYLQGLDSISVSGTHSAEFFGGLVYLCREGEIWAEFVLPDKDNPVGAASCYFKVRAGDPPLYKNGILQYTEGEWSQNNSDYHIREGHGTPLSEKSRTVTVSDAEDRIRITLTLSRGEQLPQVSIDSIELPEGVSITGSSVYLTARKSAADDADHPRYRSGEYTLQDKLLTLDSSAGSGDNISYVRAVIDFNTGGRSGRSGTAYPYRIDVRFNL